MSAIRTLKWDALGKRAVAIYTLYGLGIVSTATLFALTFQGFTKHRLGTCIAVVVAWGGLISTRTIVDDWRAQRHIAVILPQFEQAASALTIEWPTQSGEIIPGLPFYASPKYPSVLLLRGKRESYPFQENIGQTISRGFDEIIRFDLTATPGSCVEYHPNGTQPSAYKSGYGNLSPPVASAIRLKDRWYLVRYAGS